MKNPKCKICKNPYKRVRIGQVVCSGLCGIEYSRMIQAKHDKKRKQISRKELKQFNDSDKTVLKKNAQMLTNKYARLKDQLENGYRCCTCGHSEGQMDGGHFLPTSGYSSIRYNTNQIFQQCKRCNRFNGGMPKEYRVFMINRYGIDYVESLEAQKGVLRSYSVEYYQRLIKILRVKIRKIESKLRS